MAKPIIKWVGGKRQLLDEIKLLMPTNYNKYFEPFIGGGALFFDLEKENSLINDYNVELYNLYTTLRDNPLELIESLKSHLNDSEYYYKIRSLDRDIENYNLLTNIDKASRFIYLNKTCFNGLYRVNLKGQNNSPFGRYDNPKYFEEDNFYKCSELLKKTEITNGSFENIKSKINKGDFIYFDPPYDPLDKTSAFTSYTEVGFNNTMQIKVKELCDYINEIEAYFMVSNSYTPFILNLYKDYKINIVKANRTINSNGSKRNKVNEVLIINY